MVLKVLQNHNKKVSKRSPQKNTHNLFEDNAFKQAIWTSVKL